MAFSAARTTKGFEFAYILSPPKGDTPIIRDLPSAPNVAFSVGDVVKLATGLITPSSSVDAAGVCGVVDETQSAVTYGAGLLPVIIDPDAVYVVSVVGRNEETVAVAGSTAQAQGYFGGGTGATADDVPNGAYLYVYDGADKGSVYVIRDYDHTGGTVEKMYYLDRPHKMDTTSKVYWLGNSAAAGAIGPGTEADVVSGSASTIDGDADPAGGPFRVVEMTTKDGEDGTLHVKIARNHYQLDL